MQVARETTHCYQNWPPVVKYSTQYIHISPKKYNHAGCTTKVAEVLVTDAEAAENN
jgi:hypothetical protein